MPFEHTSKVPFSGPELEKRINRLNEIYRTINGLPELPNSGVFAKRITLYIEAQGIIGDLYAQAVYDHDIAEAERKEAYARFSSMIYGTAKDKEEYAEKHVTELRKVEAQCRAEMARWDKAYNNHEQYANAVKHEKSVVQDDERAGGRSNGNERW